MFDANSVPIPDQYRMNGIAFLAGLEATTPIKFPSLFITVSDEGNEIRDFDDYSLE